MSAISANPADGLQGADDAESSAACERLHDFLIARFGVKTAAELSAITGLSISGWHKSLREKREPSFRALLSLLRSPFRLQLIEVLLGADEFQLMLEEAQLEAKRQELEQRRKALRGKP